MTRKLKHGHQAPDYSLNDNRETKTLIEDKPGSNLGLKAVLSKVKRSEANAELEGGETVFGDITGSGSMQHAKVVGKSHAQGGVPLKLPQGSFVFSDSKELLITDPEVLKYFGMADNKGKGYTPAQIASKFELNKFEEISNDISNNVTSRRTADRMLEKNLKNLFSLAAYQERIKLESAPKPKKVKVKLPEFELGGPNDIDPGDEVWTAEQFNSFINKDVFKFDLDKPIEFVVPSTQAARSTTDLDVLPAGDPRIIGIDSNAVKELDQPEGPTTVAVKADAPARKTPKVRYNLSDDNTIILADDEKPSDFWAELEGRNANDVISRAGDIPDDARIGKDANGNFVAVDSKGNLVGTIQLEGQELANDSAKTYQGRHTLSPAALEGRAAADAYAAEQKQKKATPTQTATSTQTAAPAQTTTPVREKAAHVEVKPRGLDLDTGLPKHELRKTEFEDVEAPVTPETSKPDVASNAPWWAQDMISLAGALTDGVNRYDPALEQVPIETLRTRRVSADGRIAARQAAGESAMDVVENTADGQVARANAANISGQIADGASQDQAQVDSINASIENSTNAQNAQIINQGRTVNARLRDDYRTKMATTLQNTDNAQRELKQRRLRSLLNGMTNADNTQMINDMHPNMSINPLTGKIEMTEGRDIDDPTFNGTSTSEQLQKGFLEAYEKGIASGMSEETARKFAEIATKGTTRLTETNSRNESLETLELLKSLR